MKVQHEVKRLKWSPVTVSSRSSQSEEFTTSQEQQIKGQKTKLESSAKHDSQLIKGQKTKLEGAARHESVDEKVCDSHPVLKTGQVYLKCLLYASPSLGN